MPSVPGLVSDARGEVVAAVRGGLSEFCRRDRVDISEGNLDNLARWIVNAFPSGFYREFCPGAYAIAAGEVEEYTCGCSGTCYSWRRVPLDTADEIRDGGRKGAQR